MEAYILIYTCTVIDYIMVVDLFLFSSGQKRLRTFTHCTSLSTYLSSCIKAIETSITRDNVTSIEVGLVKLRLAAQYFV